MTDATFETKKKRVKFSKSSFHWLSFSKKTSKTTGSVSVFGCEFPLAFFCVRFGLSLVQRGCVSADMHPYLSFGYRMFQSALTR